jgi:hypothetical protein
VGHVARREGELAGPGREDAVLELECQLALDHVERLVEVVGVQAK